MQDCFCFAARIETADNFDSDIPESDLDSDSNTEVCAGNSTASTASTMESSKHKSVRNINYSHG